MTGSVIRINRQEGRQGFLWKRALFPAGVSCCAFICFAYVYWFVTATAINPYYIAGLLFAVPGLLFALITYLAGKGKLNAVATVTITVVLIPVLVICSFFYFFIISLDASFATVTDISRYERAMKLAGYPEYEPLAVFPEKIPGDARNVVFYYNIAAWLDYEETAVLRFSASQETIDGYIVRINEAACQTEGADDAGIRNGWDKVGDDGVKDLPADYTVYVIINSGKKFCVVSVSREKNDIIFYAGYYSWL